MKIGNSTIPRMRVPALLKGEMIALDLTSLQGQWGILCRLPEFEFGEVIFLNQYLRTVQKEGATLLGMLPCADLFFDPHLPKAKILGIPLVMDPLRRLHRVLGLSSEPSSTRCQSFIFDPKGVIRYHLVHLLNWRGMSFLLEILKHCQELYPQLTQPRISRPVPNTRLILEQPQDRRTLLTLIPTPSPDYAGGKCYATESTPKAECL